MKRRTKAPPAGLGQALAEFEQLPAETKRLLKLQHQTEKATGKAAVQLQEALRKHSGSM